jgi:hypothetical protein
VKVAFIYGHEPSSTLTRFFTGSTCYHVGFTDGVQFWDMNLLRRRRRWAGLYPADKVVLVDTPVPVSREFLEELLETDDSRYGFFDYLLFGLRWAYHLVGASTRNAGGTICSELVAEDLAACGWTVRFPEVPSPADLEVALLGRLDAIKKSTRTGGV